MQNFTLHNPTKIYFGKDQIQKLSGAIPAGNKVLLTYGGGSIKKNGIYTQVMQALERYQVVEFGGIEPNPTYETLMKAVEVIRNQDITFILAVGGGSVIDGTKFISVAAPFEGEPWDILEKGATIHQAIPFGTVLTLPATGSEMNPYAVISQQATRQKLDFGSTHTYPVFSVLDPKVVCSLPARQIANGVVDAFTHVLEQYLTYPIGATLQDRISESILQTLTDEGPKVYQDPMNYEAAANLMWCSTMALNGLISAGVPGDWTTHKIGHELTALYGIDHARTLAIVMPHLFRVMKESKQEKLLQYGERVWGITSGSTEEKIEEALRKTVEFYHALGIQTRLSEYTDDYANAPVFIAERFQQRGWTTLGERKEITPDKVQKIVEDSL